MPKIKKIYKYTLFPFLILVLLLGSSFLSMRIPAVQTYLGKRILSRVSSNIRGEVEFSSISFTFFNKVVVSDFLLRDGYADTLIYSPLLEANIRNMIRKERLLHLGRVTAESPLIYLKKDSTGELNLNYFIRLITPEDTSKTNREMAVDRIRVFNADIYYDDLARGKGGNGTLDLNHLAINDLNLTIDKLEKNWDRIGFVLSELSFNTPEGFTIYDLFAEADISRDHFYLLDPTLRSSNSLINSDLIGLDFVGRDSSFNFTTDASLNLKFNRSLLGLPDLGYFIGALEGFNQALMLSGDFRGTVSELKGRDIDITYSDSTRLLCDFDLSGLPDITSTFIFMDVEELTSHTSDIESVFIPGKGNIDLGPELRRLGNLSFKGNFTGFITDFVTYGDFRSDLGMISTDILFSPDTTNTFVYSGSLQAFGIDLGTILDQGDLLGKLSFTANVDGSSESFGKFNATLQGSIDSLDLNGYTYRDIALNGTFTEKIWDGSVVSENEDLRMDVLGRFDFSNGTPEFDFTLNLLDADLLALNIDRADSSSRLSMLMTASFQGSKIDDANGEIRLLNSRLLRNGKEFDLYDCSLKASNNEERNSLELRTDIADARIEGKYDIRSMLSDLKSVAAHLMPSYFIREDQLYSISSNRFSYDVTIKETNALSNFLGAGIYISPNTVITGTIDPDSLITVKAYSDYFTYNNNNMVDITFNGTIEDTVSAIELGSSRISLGGRIELDNFVTSLTSKPDRFGFRLGWNNDGTKGSHGEILAEGNLSRLGITGPRVEVEVLPATLLINDKEWEISRSGFTVDSTSFMVNGLEVRHGTDLFGIDGSISRNRKDTLYIELRNLDLSALNDLKKVEQETGANKIEFYVRGMLDGKVMLTDLYNDFLFETDLRVRNFMTNDHDHGRVDLITNWDNSNRVARVSLRNDINGSNTFDINGIYDPASREIDLDTRLNSFPLDILNLVLGSFASEVRGYGTGSAELKGPLADLNIYGSVMADNTSMAIDYLRTRFSFSDSIRLGGNSFIFENIDLTDDRGNKAVLDGAVTHSKFREFDIDLRINVDNMLVLDTREKDNSLFYGTAYGSGVATISGPTEALKLNISARTGRNTRMFIPLNATEVISDYPFITFISADTASSREGLYNIPVRAPAQPSTLELNFDLDVTPEAEVQLVFDSRLGDVMRARGTGKLNLDLGKDGTFSIFGDYIVEDGDYLLTLGNIFNKRFVVENGGRISWDGDVTNADINIKAIYKLKASLFELFQDEAFRARIPVECHLNMTGKLVNPVISFDIYLPTADEETRTYLRNTINTEEQMSRQFLYLLVMNSFYPDPSYAGALSTTSAGAEAMGVTTTEMLSNQLSNWLSQISNDFDIGFNYRPGNEISSQEVEVALSTQLLNDRVVINGNFDVGGQETTSTTQDITGDFNVEVKLTEKVRLKVFNRSNDNILYETAPYTQGIGLFFRKDFDHFREIFRRSRSSAKKEDEPVITEDSR